MKKILYSLLKNKESSGRLGEAKKFAKEQFAILVKKGLKFPVTAFHL